MMMAFLSRVFPEMCIRDRYREIGESYKGLDRWSMYLITAYDKAENDIGRKADKNRKIYNGMMKTYYYQFLGPRPPKKGSIKE